MCHHPYVSVGLVLLAMVGLLTLLLVPWWVVVLTGVGVALSGYLLARTIARSLPRRPLVGVESLPGTIGVVTTRNPRGSAFPYVVRVDGELWSARSPEGLIVGEHALVLEVERNCLLICRVPLELASRW